jgi:predicted Zn-dependent protease
LTRKILSTKLKPLYLAYEEGVPKHFVKAAMAAITSMLDLGNVTGQVPFKNLGVWRTHDWIVGPVGARAFTAYNSVDWYLATGREASERSGQINMRAIQQAQFDDPWQLTNPHYTVLLTHQDVYAEGLNYMLGSSLVGLGCVMSTHRFMELGNIHTQAECFQTMTMHELGHVFGLVPKGRTVNVEESLGKHCTNECLMRQGLGGIADNVQHTIDRIQGEPLCLHCLYDLRSYFRQ